jgi:hypothetical protein
VITVLPPLFAALATTALFAALYAFFRSVRAALSPGSGLVDEDLALAARRAELLERKERLLGDLHDLEIERAGGKLGESDFEAMQAKMRAEAKRVLAALDQDVAPFRAEAEALIDEAVRAAAAEPRGGKGKGKARTKTTPETPKAKADEPAAARTCASCSAKNDTDAEFCKKCGKALATGAGPGDEGDEKP